MCTLRRQLQVLVGPPEQLGIFQQMWKISPVHQPGRPTSAFFRPCVSGMTELSIKDFCLSWPRPLS